MALDPVSAIKIGGSLLGLFGKKKKAPTPAQNIMSQAKGARQAADTYGFNPLTMLQYGNPGGSMAAGEAPPLASIDMLVDGLQDIDDINSGRRERQDKLEQMKLELATRELEALEANQLRLRTQATAAVGGDLPRLGTGSTVRTAGAPPYSADELTAPTLLAPGRDVTADPVKNLPGFVKINNAFTGPLVLPGEEAPEGFEAYAMAPLALPQMAYNYARWNAGKDKEGGDNFRGLLGLPPQNRDALPFRVDLTPGIPVKSSYDFRSWPFDGFSPSNYRK